MMKRFTAVIIIIGLLFSAFAEVSKPSFDGRARVAEIGELPVGLFAKSAGFLPGDTVIVTNPASKISIEVMIFGNIGASEGIAIVLSPEAARELYITKGSNVIVQVTKKSDTYTESSVLSKTLRNYTPEETLDEIAAEPEFDTPAEETEAFYFYTDPDAVIEKEAAEVAIEETESEYVAEMEPVTEEVPFEEPEWPEEVVETEEIPAEPVEEEVAFEEPEWPAEVVETEEIPAEPVEEEVAFEEPEWPEEVIIEYVEIEDEPEIAELPDENDNFIEETETVLIPAEPNPPTYESIILDEPEVVIIPVFEEEPAVVMIEEPVEEVAEEPVVEVIEEVPIEIIPVVVETPEVIEEEAVTIPYGEIETGKWYVQIATCSKLESVENIVRTYGAKYPLVVVKLASGDMRVLVGSLSADEYPTILARFKAYGFKDAFVRSR